MKFFFYKLSRNLPVVMLVMIYFWVLIPFALCLDENMKVYASPLNFVLAGVIYVLECSNDEKTKFDKYITCLPVKRSTYVSYMFLLLVISEIVMYFSQILLGVVSPQILERNLMTENTPIVLLSSMCIGMAIVGFAVFLNFKKSFSVSGAAILILYFLVSFICGFIQGLTEGSESASAFLNSVGFRITASLIALAVFVFEWWISGKGVQ